MRLYLKDARLKKGLTQAQIAKLIGISQNYYCDIENGMRQRDIKTSTLINLSTVLNIPIDEMVKAERGFSLKNINISPNKT